MEKVMSNSQQPSDQPIGVIRTSYTVSVTFTAKPSEELRTKLKSAGYRFENSHWFKNQTEGSLATLATADQLLVA
jgi:hypothetical protein